MAEARLTMTAAILKVLNLTCKEGKRCIDDGVAVKKKIYIIYLIVPLEEKGE